MNELVRTLSGVEVIVAMRERTGFSAEVLRRLPDLRLLVSTGRQNAAIDVAAATQQGIVVSATAYFPEPAIELTWALILAAARDLPVEERSMRDGGLQRTVGTGLHGKTLGILGLGRIGSKVARIGEAFGMDTVAWSQSLTPERAADHGVKAVTKHELLTTADVLSVHLVLSERSKGLVGSAELAAMKPSASS